MRSLTHKGWFLFCPVFMTDPNTDAETRVIPRRSQYQWLLGLSMDVQFLYANTVEFFKPGHEPKLLIWTTGEI